MRLSPEKVDDLAMEVLMKCLFASDVKLSMVSRVAGLT
jgi:hypothetical protein